jgi:hypothetical protein
MNPLILITQHFFFILSYSYYSKRKENDSVDFFLLTYKYDKSVVLFDNHTGFFLFYVLRSFLLTEWVLMDVSQIYIV